MNSISIIVPMYNVSHYVERCLRSLAKQDISVEDYEIICVNDGSPDNCKEIIEHLQKEIPNIILIDQENQGVSMARNNAIARAKGKYIMPIDPDDYVHPNVLKAALERADRERLEVLYLGYDFLDEKGKLIWQAPYNSMKNSIFTGVDAYFAARGPNIMDPDRSVAVLYRKDFLDHYGLRYPQNVPFLEDGLFLGKVLSVAARCGFDERPFYQRTTRPGSATNSRLIYSWNALKGFALAAEDIQNFGKKNELSIEQKGLINHVTAKFIFLPVTACVGSMDIQSFRNIKLLLKSHQFYPLRLSGCRGIYLQFGRIFNISMDLFFGYYYFLTRMYAVKFRLKALLRIIVTQFAFERLNNLTRNVTR